MMGALGKFLLKQGDNMAPGAMNFARKHKMPLGIGAGVAGAYGASEVAEPYVDEMMTDRALEGMGRELNRGVDATAEFGEEHPMALAALLGSAGLVGSRLGGGGGGSDINLNTILGATQSQGDPRRRGRR